MGSASTFKYNMVTATLDSGCYNSPEAIYSNRWIHVPVLFSVIEDVVLDIKECSNILMHHLGF